MRFPFGWVDQLNLYQKKKTFARGLLEALDPPDAAEKDPCYARKLAAISFSIAHCANKTIV